MTNKMANNKGFTLIEIIIVIAVLGVLSIFGFHFLSTAIHTYSIMEKQKDLFDQAAMAMERISRELRDANSIAESTCGQTLKFTKSHVTDQDSKTTITFSLAGSNLRRRGAVVGVHLADNVTAYDVLRVISGISEEKEEITITLTLQKAGAGEITLRTYVCPKNLAGVNYSGRNFGGNWEEDFQ